MLRVFLYGAIGRRIDPVCGMVHIKEPLLLIGWSTFGVAAAGFLSRHITVLSCVECVVN